MAEEVKTHKLEEKKMEEKKEVESKEKHDASKKMDSKKKEEVKVVLEREYVVPLRKGFMKVPKHSRAKKAIKTLKEFIAKHMKVEERDLKKVKVNIYLNNEIWFKGIKKPLHKIKVKAVKKSDGNVYVELVDIPDKVKFDMARHKKRFDSVKNITKKEDKAHKEERVGREDKVETPEEKKDEMEKEKATVEAGLKAQKAHAKEAKHTTKGKHANTTAPVRKALKK